MLAKKITYTDYNGVERTENFYFNLNESELIRMDVHDGLASTIQRIVDAKEAVEIMDLFEKVIRAAYGVKSEDGKRFIKRKNGVDVAEDFIESEAYNVLFMELLNDEEKTKQFFEGIVPKPKA